MPRAALPQSKAVAAAPAATQAQASYFLGGNALTAGVKSDSDSDEVEHKEMAALFAAEAVVK